MKSQKKNVPQRSIGNIMSDFLLLSEDESEVLKGGFVALSSYYTSFTSTNGTCHNYTECEDSTNNVECTNTEGHCGNAKNNGVCNEPIQ